MIAPDARRSALLTLGAAAILSLVVAVVAVLLPAKGAQWWLIGCLAALALVVAAEVVILVLDRREPQDEVYDFIIEGEAP